MWLMLGCREKGWFANKYSGPHLALNPIPAKLGKLVPAQLSPPHLYVNTAYDWVPSVAITTWKLFPYSWKCNTYSESVQNNLKFQCNTVGAYVCTCTKFTITSKHLSSEGHTSIHLATNTQVALNSTFSSSSIKSLVRSSKHDSVGWLRVTVAYLTIPLFLRSMPAQ